MSKADRRARKRENRLQGQAQRAAEAKKQKQRSGLIRGGIVVVIIVIGFGIIIATGHKSKKSSSSTTIASACTHTQPPRGSTATYKKAPAMTIDPTKTYTATMTTSCGTITMVLDPKEAPKTVNSFVFLARAHFFDGLKFHRVVPDFVVQGGDPTGNGNGGPGYSLPTEGPKNGYKAGSVAMANTGKPGTTGSQFFLVASANGAKTLGGPPYTYSILGQMDAKSLAVVQQMEKFARPAAEADGSQPPTQPLYIDKVTISES